MLKEVKSSILVRYEDSSSRKLAEINYSKLNKGEAIYIAGWKNPQGSETGRSDVSDLLFTSGNITNINQRGKDGYQLKYTNDTVRGMSGGPILNQDGKLIGIHGRVGGGIPISQYPR
jgi:Trypsin-like peptidase domain